MRILATPFASVRPAKRPTWTRALATGAPVSPSKTITCTFERFGGGAGFGLGGGFSAAAGGLGGRRRRLPGRGTTGGEQREHEQWGDQAHPPQARQTAAVAVRRFYRVPSAFSHISGAPSRR